MHASFTVRVWALRNFPLSSETIDDLLLAALHSSHSRSGALPPPAICPNNYRLVNLDRERDSPTFSLTESV